MDKRTSIYKRISLIVGITTLLLGLIPVPVLGRVGMVSADDGGVVEPPPSEAPVAQEETSEPAPAEAALADEAPATEAAPADQTPAEEVPADAVPIEEMPLEEAFIEESTAGETAQVTVSEPASAAEEEPAAEAAPVTEVVDALAEADAVLFNENEEVVPLASEEAAAILAAADPWFTDGTDTYRYFADPGVCAALYPGDLNCHDNLANPIQEAIDDAKVTPLFDGTINVEPGTYASSITIDVEGLTLLGLPGNLLLAGAAFNAPIIQGGGSGTGVTITAKGVSLVGFVIQGWDTGVLVDAASGNVSINILNNTIKNNTTGIKHVGDTGKPHLEVHYNIFENNDFAIENSSSNNVQYVDAQDNYWGCPEGPIVEDPDENTFYFWATKQVIDPANYPDCEMLNGQDDLWDHQKPGNDPITSPGYWSPFKINLNSLAEPECPLIRTNDNLLTENLCDQGDDDDDTGDDDDDTGDDDDDTGDDDDDTTTTTTVALVIPVTGFAQLPLITAGLGHTCAITPSTGLICWGLNESGQLGDGTFNDSNIPVDVANAFEGGVVDLISGTKHTCVLTDSGNVYCWGLNDSGQLGNGSNANSNVPVLVEGLGGDVVSISAGAEFTCAVKANDEVFCWGNNESGQLNDGTQTNQNLPVLAKNVQNAVLVSGGSGELQGIVSGGQLSLWSNLPVIPVTGSEANTNVFLDANRFLEGGCILDETGEVNCWGENTDTEVSSPLNSDLLASGGRHACTVNENGLVCWGSNTSGQLGIGTFEDSMEAKVVPGIASVLDLDTGNNHTCVIVDNVTIKCFGENTYGQLGDGKNENSPDPVDVL